MSQQGTLMREPTYFVLASLTEGPLHGYGIIKRTGELSAGRVRLVTGKLYTALDRLSRAGYVSVVSEHGVAGRVRRTYGLTRAGHTALQAAATRKQQATSASGRPTMVGAIVVIGGRLRVGGKDRTP